MPTCSVTADLPCGDDGCGGSCGECSDGLACLDGGCAPPEDPGPGCVASCDGKQCGGDGCGGLCGTCASGLCQGGQCIGGADVDPGTQSGGGSGSGDGGATGGPTAQIVTTEGCSPTSRGGPSPWGALLVLWGWTRLRRQTAAPSR